MWRVQHPPTMEFRAPELVTMLILPLIHIARTAAAERILSCDVTSLEPCGDSQQVCNATSLACQCLPGLRLVEGRCERAGGAGGGARAALGGAAALLLGALLLAALLLLARRYGGAARPWLRQRLRLQPRSTAYEDVMIGADDPPLSL